MWGKFFCRIHFLLNILAKQWCIILVLYRLETPAPFILCDIDDLDLRGNEQYCPPERLALVAFYQSTKGDDWNNNAK